MQHIVHFAVQKRRIVTIAEIFSCQNNSFLINDASLFKVVAFNVPLFDVAQSESLHSQQNKTVVKIIQYVIGLVNSR